MKNSLQLLDSNNNEFKNQNSLKRKRNFTGKENIDPSPTNKKEQTKFILTKPSTTTTATTSNADKPNLLFEALLEVASVEYELLILAQEENNSVASTLIAKDPFFNEYYEYIQCFPDKIQLLLSEFQDLDAQQIVKTHQLNLLKTALTSKQESTVNRNEEQLLNKTHIVLKQNEIISDQKIQKANQIKELVKIHFQQLGIDYDTKDGSAPIVDLNDKKILDNFKHKIQTNDFKSKNKKLKTNAKTSKESNDDIFTPDNSSDEGNQSDKESSSSVASNASTDPDDLFCICRRSSFGKMIYCDNESCEIGWFHFGCVQLKVKPKGDWFCSSCIKKSTNKKKKF